MASLSIEHRNVDTAQAYGNERGVGEEMLELTHAAAEDRASFAAEEGTRFYGQTMTAAQLAWEAAEIIFRNSSSSAARDGQRMQRCWRDIRACRSNGIHQLSHRATAIARTHYGMSPRFF